eukprot:TRINITY_DN7581_c0_g1_i1.p2 TRINITY_DN7581_c0_g1~~TRINITY_DN7581_c0_g1_i1.p2  ORF type:complete len:115 (-),score=35.51 TRINITY_DN7581_c0_g1_i1:253-597(-)
MAELIDEYNDAGMPADLEHMKYSHLKMDSVSRLGDFMSGPLQQDVGSVPGIGDATVKALAALEIYTLTQLMGKFMSFDRDCSLMLGWLEENKLCGRYAETTVHALAMKLHSLLD